MAREMAEKNEALMREGWARDDTAVQRRTADLKAAGLSPVLAAGSAAGASNPIKMDSPRSEDWASGAMSSGVNSMLALSNYAKTNMDNLRTEQEMKNMQSMNIKTQYETASMEFRNHLDRLIAMKQMGVMTSQEAKNYSEVAGQKLDQRLKKLDVANSEQQDSNIYSQSPLRKMAGEAGKAMQKSIEGSMPGLNQQGILNEIGKRKGHKNPFSD